MNDLDCRLSGIHELLPRVAAGEAAALDALLRHCRERLTLLTRRMLGDFQRVRRWAETDDVLQNALIRLVGALRSTQPRTSREFLALASLQIRRELIDLARHYYGPQGIGANHDSQPPAEARRADAAEPADARHDPASLTQWTEIRELIDGLSAEDREIIGLLFYQGLAQAEAAEVLGVSLRTVQRRWHDALCRLHRVLDGS